ILPPYARRSKSLEVLIPILYLKGISTGDFEDALIALLGRDAGGLSASTIGRLKEAWCEEYARWSKRDLSAKRSIYFWVDGIHPSRSNGPMTADHHRSHPRGQEGACRSDRRRSRKCAILAGTAPRSEAAWAVDWPRARGRRWRARILAGGGRGLAPDRRPARLGATNRPRT